MSTDKIIAYGLVATTIVYAIGSVILGTPISEAILGTVLGGLIGVLKSSDIKGDKDKSQSAQGAPESKGETGNGKE